MDLKKKESLKEVIKESRGIDVEILEDGSTFEFKCDCCGNCCNNQTLESILLKPYDIYRIAKSTGLTAGEVVQKYTETYIGNTSGFPVVRMVGNSKGHCHFLKDNKCTINTNKPGSCSLYPLGRIYNPTEDEIIYFIQTIHCGDKGVTHTLDSWFNGHKEYEEASIKLEGDMTGEIRKFLNLPKVAELMRNVPTMTFISLAYEDLLISYYTEYDTSKDFLPQLKENIKNTIRDALVLAKTINDTLGSAPYPEIRKYVKEEVLGKEFNERVKEITL